MAKDHNVNDKMPAESLAVSSYFDAMIEDSSDEAVGTRLATARLKKKLTQNALARMLGVDQSTLGHWERGRGSPGREHVRKLEVILGVTADWITYGREPGPVASSSRLEIGVVNPPPRPTLEAMVDFSKAIPTEDGPRDLPVFGSVKGGFDGSEIDYHDPVEWIQRPPALMNVNKACACYVINDSMEPRYFEGEMVLVHPSKPVRAGDFVVVEISGHRGMVKRFRRKTDTFVELEQYNPPEVVKLPRSEVVGIHLIIGSYSK